MATFTVTWDVPDDKAVDVRDTLCTRWGYNAQTDGTKVEFLRRKIRDRVKEEYIQQKRDEAQMSIQSLITDAASVSFT